MSREEPSSRPRRARDIYDTGYHGSVMVNVNAPVSPIGFRLEGMYARANEKDLVGRSGNVQIGAGTINLVLGPRTVAVKPYFVGGAFITSGSPRPRTS